MKIRTRIFPVAAMVCCVAFVYLTGCSLDHADVKKTSYKKHMVPKPKPSPRQKRPFTLVDDPEKTVQRYPRVDYRSFGGKPGVMVQRSHEKGIVDIAVTPDGQLIVSASRDRTVKIWNIDGVLLKSVPIYDDDIRCIAVSADGREIAVGADRAVYLLDIEGHLKRKLAGENHSIRGYYPDIVYIPDGSVITTNGFEKVVIRDAGWNPRREIKVSDGFIRHIAVSPDGRYFVTCGKHTRSRDGWEATARMWDMQGNLVTDLETNKPGRSGERLQEKYFHEAVAADFSPDGMTIAVLGANGSQLRLRSLKARLIRKFNVTLSTGARACIYAPDGSGIILRGSSDFRKYSLDGRMLGVIYPFHEYETGNSKNRGWITCAVLTGDGLNLVAGFHGSGYINGALRIWDRRGTMRRDLRPAAVEVRRIVFSPDVSRLYLEVEHAKKTAVWNLKGMYLKEINEGVGFTMDGREFRYYLDRWRNFFLKVDGRETRFKGRLVVPLPDGTVLHGPSGVVYELNGTPKKRLHFERRGSGGLAPLYEIAVEMNMKYYVLETNTSHGGVHKIVRFDTDAKKINTINIKNPLGSGAIAARNGLIATGHKNGLIRIWTTSGKMIKEFQAHLLAVNALAFSPGGKFLVSTSRDRITRIWDMRTGRSVGLIILDRGEWIVFDNDGRFDCSGGARNYIKYVRGLTAFDTRQLWDTLHTPGLLTDFLEGISPAGVNIVSVIKTAPKVTVSIGPRTDKKKTVTVNVCTTPGKDGIGNVFVLHNGRVVSGSSRGVIMAASGNCRYFTLQLEPGVNIITGAAYDRSNLIYGTSRELSVRYDPSVIVKPDMHIIAVGVSKYWDSNLRLGYPADDARAISYAMRKTGSTIYGNIGVHLLENDRATRESILNAMKKVSGSVKKSDVVIIFLAGHGETEKGTYYYLPYDADLTNLKQTCLSVKHINDFTRGLAANKVVLLFDTCKSGAATEALHKIAAARGLEERRIIARIAREHGIAVFSAASVSQAAYEIRELRHGIFTYCLLEALRTEPSGIAENGIITVARLLARVNRTTRDTALRYLKVEQNPVVYMFGDDFGLGRVR